MITQYLNKIIQGDCLELLKPIPDNSIDMTFADPPFNLKKGYKSYRDHFLVPTLCVGMHVRDARRSVPSTLDAERLSGIPTQSVGTRILHSRESIGAIFHIALQRVHRCNIPYCTPLEHNMKYCEQELNK
jgi:hypothetical protein